MQAYAGDCTVRAARCLVRGDKVTNVHGVKMSQVPSGSLCAAVYSHHIDSLDADGKSDKMSKRQRHNVKFAGMDDMS